MLVVCTAGYVFLTYGIYYQSLPPVFTMGTCYRCLLPFTTSILDILEVSTISVYTTAVYTTGMYYWCRYYQCRNYCILHILEVSAISVYATGVYPSVIYYHCRYCLYLLSV